MDQIIGQTGAVEPHDRTRAGLVVFVESIRWLGVPWGMRSVAAGLRDAGFRGRFLYWRWHATWRGCLVLPAIADGKLLEREAGRLAAFLARCRRRRSDLRINERRSTTSTARTLKPLISARRSSVVMVSGSI